MSMHWCHTHIKISIFVTLNNKIYLSELSTFYYFYLAELLQELNIFLSEIANNVEI